MRKVRLEIGEPTELIKVEETVNDLIVNQRKIKMTDFTTVILKHLDTHFLMDALLEEEDWDEIIRSLLHRTGSLGIRPDELFGTLLDAVNLYEHNGLASKLFRELGSSINLEELDSKLWTNILNGLLERVTHVKDIKIIEELLSALIRKSELFTNKEMFYPKLFKAITLNLQKEQEELGAYVTTALEALDVKKLNQIISHFSLDRSISSPILPKNCVFYQEGKNRRVVGIEHEKCLHDVVLEGHQGGEPSLYKNVGHPNLLFWFAQMKNRVLAKVAAYKDVILNEETKLYHYPYSNVNTEGSICWSTLNQVGYKDLRQLESLPYRFLRAPKNFDLYQRDYTGKDLRSLLISMQDTPFDEELLVPMGLKVADILYN
ncbi:hypothetical protein [Paenibacillus thiaminolyticus]|nr:hypothetical protein [Paenibacillus thiaminolyticus]